MVKADKSLCLRCGGCVAVCPKSVLTLAEQGIVCNDECNNCGICVNFCPMGALKLQRDTGRRYK